MTVDLHTIQLGEKQHANRQFSFALLALTLPSPSASPLSSPSASSLSLSLTHTHISPAASPSLTPSSPGLGLGSTSTEDGHRVLVWIACCTELELDQWRQALFLARSLEAVPVPVSRPIPSSQRTQTSLFRSKLSPFVSFYLLTLG